MKFRPFRWYGESEINRFRLELSGRLTQWALHWGIASAGPSENPMLQVLQGEELQSHQQLLRTLIQPPDDLSDVRVYGNAGRQVLLTMAAQQQLAETLLNRPLTPILCAHPMCQTLLDKVFEDLDSRLGNKPVPPENYDYIDARASGWLLIQAKWSTIALDLLFSPAATLMLLPMEKPQKRFDRPRPASEALQHLVAPMRAELSPVSLTIGELTGLVVGDVVRIPHAMSEPVFVKTIDGDPMCRAKLGKHDQQRALKMVSAS